MGLTPAARAAPWLPATRARRLAQVLAELAAGDRYMRMAYRGGRS